LSEKAWILRTSVSELPGRADAMRGEHLPVGIGKVGYRISQENLSLLRTSGFYHVRDLDVSLCWDGAEKHLQWSQTSDNKTA
jgi:hypothetical protein